MIQLVASLTINPDEPEALRTYFETAARLMARYNGTLVQRIELGDPVVGEKVSEIIMVVNYPSYTEVDEMFASATYRSVIPMRDKAFLKYNVCIVSLNEYA